MRGLEAWEGAEPKTPLFTAPEPLWLKMAARRAFEATGRSKALLRRAFEATWRSKWLLGHAFEVTGRSKALLRRAFEATWRSKWLLGHAFEATGHSKAMLRHAFEATWRCPKPAHRHSDTAVRSQSRFKFTVRNLRSCCNHSHIHSL